MVQSLQILIGGFENSGADWLLRRTVSSIRSSNITQTIHKLEEPERDECDFEITRILI